MSSLPRAFAAPVAPPDCLAGGGETGGLFRAFDWAASPLGPAAGWPQSLKTSISICLNSQFALVNWWGPELVFLYNDGYAPVLGDKHPDALGRAGRTVWPEIWPTIGPMLARVVDTGEATCNDDLRLILERRGYPEECYFTFSSSAIRDETGGVGGVFTAVLETTETVLRERRLRTLRELAEAGEAALARRGDRHHRAQARRAGAARGPPAARADTGDRRSRLLGVRPGRRRRIVVRRALPHHGRSGWRVETRSGGKPAPGPSGRPGARARSAAKRARAWSELPARVSRSTSQWRGARAAGALRSHRQWRRRRG